MTPAQKPLRYIQIGVGGHGQHWCATVMPHLKKLGLAVPAAAVDINPDMLGQAKRQLNLDDAQLYTRAEQALAEQDADFIIIVVPPAAHEEMVDLAIRYDRHILSEKPIADTMEVSCRIFQKVKGAGLKMAVTMSHRFDQDKQTLQSQIHSGSYGRLDYLVGRNTWTYRKRGQWGLEYPYDIADPLLIESLVHHFDIMRSLTGANAESVHCVTWNPEWSEFRGDAQAVMLVEMENGAKVFYEGAAANASQLNDWFQDYWRAECELATLELDKRQLRIHAQLEEAFEKEIPLLEQEAWMNSWLAELFCQWLPGGAEPPNSLEDNIQCAALLFAALESAHSKKIVEVQPFLHKHLNQAGL